MQVLAHLDAEWASIEEYSDFSLLPEGNRNYEVVSAEARHNPRLDNRPEIVLKLRSEAGRGEHTIPLRPSNPSDPEAVQKWKRRLKTDLPKLGFTGTPGQLGAYLPQLKGAIIELSVDHEPNSAGRVNPQTGELYMNQLVRIERFVRGPQEAAAAAPAAAPVEQHQGTPAPGNLPTSAQIRQGAGSPEAAAAAAFTPQPAGADDDIPF